MIKWTATHDKICHLVLFDPYLNHIYKRRSNQVLANERKNKKRVHKFSIISITSEYFAIGMASVKWNFTFNRQNLMTSTASAESRNLCSEMIPLLAVQPVYNKSIIITMYSYLPYIVENREKVKKRRKKPKLPQSVSRFCWKWQKLKKIIGKFFDVTN